MLKTSLAFCFALVTTPLLAQSGDCAAETGTTTTWAVTSSGVDFVDILYTFHAAGLLGQSEIERSSGIAPGTNLTDFANSQCESVDVSREADELLIARIMVEAMVGIGSTPEVVQPEYPEVCPALFANPSNAGGTAVQDCRKASFHQALFREVWPEDALTVFNAIYGIFDWLSRNNVQGGAAFNVLDRREWLSLTGTQWTTMVNPRMSNQDAISSGLRNDPQWQGELE